MNTAHTTSSCLDELEARLAASRAQLRDIATMGAVITRIHDIDAVLSVVMDMAVRLVAGEVGIIMTEHEGSLRGQAAWGVTEEFVRLLQYEEGMDLATYCFHRKEPVVLSGLHLKSDEGIRINSVIALPLLTRDKCLGVIIIINKADGGDYTEEDREALEMLLSFVTVAIENSNLLLEQLARQKIEQEMVIARQVQETILPGGDSELPDVDIGAIYFPAREVGGDFYDIIKIDDHSFLVVLGDVSNKGVPAALIMSACSGIIKSLMATDPTLDVAALAGRLNTLMAEQIIRDREMFVTLFFARFDLEHSEITYCNAGHIPGLFWDDQANRIVELPEGGPIIGQFPGITFKQGKRAIRSGDRLFLFTDGLTEATDSEGRLFGRERVEQVFSAEIELAPKEFCGKVKEWVDRFSEGAPEDMQDDFTILQVRIR